MQLNQYKENKNDSINNNGDNSKNKNNDGNTIIIIVIIIKSLFQPGDFSAESTTEYYCPLGTLTPTFDFATLPAPRPCKNLHAETQTETQTPTTHTHHQNTVQTSKLSLIFKTQTKIAQQAKILKEKTKFSSNSKPLKCYKCNRQNAYISKFIILCNRKMVLFGYSEKAIIGIDNALIQLRDFNFDLSFTFDGVMLAIYYGLQMYFNLMYVFYFTILI